MSLVPAAPQPRAVMSPDGRRIATYDFGDPDAPAVVAVHGFASAALLNWHASGWTRDLVRAGYRVVALDQRGHGASSKPHEPDAYSMDLLVADVTTVIDTYLLDDVAFLGYSLGARVGWHTAERIPDRITRAVLGGIPDADPMRRVRVDQARAFITDGTPVEDRVTKGYLTMAAQRRGQRPPGPRGDGRGDAEQRRADAGERPRAAGPDGGGQRGRHPRQCRAAGRGGAERVVLRDPGAQPLQRPDVAARSAKRRSRSSDKSA